MSLPVDYAERVYAGVLGKIIGVYLGRPFEGWTYQRIMNELGEIQYYVHEKLNKPLIVTDDDITGTFTFIRALSDHGNRKNISAKEIGETWRNYIIENRSILWWGGMGNSTEHTAYLRLKKGVQAPESGSAVLNGKVVSEQIGAQIFIDGWGMVAPGDPELAVYLAKQAGSVSHDGEALYGAQVLAAMEALAFMEPDLNCLIDTAIKYIPSESIIFHLIQDVREWHSEYPDWHDTFQKIVTHYGYNRYGGNCHIVPNHALIHLGLLYGENDFQKTLMITNTAGWDTDCNSGNVGCLMGIKNGLSGLETGPDWRNPVADRVLLPTADCGRVISDAVREAVEIVNMGRVLAGEAEWKPKNGARFHFEFPGSVQGFQPDDSIESRGTLRIENVEGHSLIGKRSLALRFQGVAHARPARAATATFVPPGAMNMGVYSLMSAPTLYSGQKVFGRLTADPLNLDPVNVGLFIRYYGDQDVLTRLSGPSHLISPGEEWNFQWLIPEIGGVPIFEVGVEIFSDVRRDGVLYLDYLSWHGEPNVTWTGGKQPGMYQRAWVDGVSMLIIHPPELMRLVQNEGCGMVMTGSREWRNYRVEVEATPHMLEKFGIAARVQGLRRYCAFELSRNGRARLVKYWDDTIQVLADTEFHFEFGRTYLLKIEVKGNQVHAWVEHQMVLSAPIDIQDGWIGIICEEGRLGVHQVRVSPG